MQAPYSLCRCIWMEPTDSTISFLVPTITVFGASEDAQTLVKHRLAADSFAVQSAKIIIGEFRCSNTANDEFFESKTFQSILTSVAAKNVSSIIVPSSTTLSDDPVVQATAYQVLRKYRIDLIALRAGTRYNLDIEAHTHVSRIFEIAERIDHKLRQMDERRRLGFGPRRRKLYVEMSPEAVALVKRVHKERLAEGKTISLRELSAILALRGLLNSMGKPYHPDAIRRMLSGPDPLLGKAS
jgi:hypothetical protein